MDCQEAKLGELCHPCLALSRLARPIIVSTTIAGSCDKKFTCQNKRDIHKKFDNKHLAANILPSTAQLEDRKTPSQHSNKMRSAGLSSFLFVAFYFTSQKAQIPDCCVQNQTWTAKKKAVCSSLFSPDLPFLALVGISPESDKDHHFSGLREELGLPTEQESERTFRKEDKDTEDFADE